MPREAGAPFIAEVQVALSGIAILKKSEQKVYSIMRMTCAAELLDTFVFDDGQEAKRGSLLPPLPAGVEEVNIEAAAVQILAQEEEKREEYKGGLSHQFELERESRRLAARQAQGEEAHDDGLVDETNLRVLVAERNAAYKERDEAIRHAKQIEKDFEKLKKELKGSGNQAESMGTADDLRARFRCGVDLFSCATSPPCDKAD